MKSDITLLLKDMALGDQKAASLLMPRVYNELRRLAASYMRRERPNHTLQATALVNEAYLKLVKQQTVDWESRAQFFGFAAHLMREILVDHARAHGRQRRGAGNEPLALEDVFVFSPEKSEEVLRLNESLSQLAKRDPRQARIVELRFFGGLSVEETASVLGISPRTVKREWSMAKAWLHGDLKKDHGNSAAQLGKA